MPIIKSAKKRVRQTKKATVRNAKTKRNLRDALKAFAKNVGTSKSADTHAKAQSALDTAAKKGLMHKNKVARKKRQLAAAAKKSGASVSGDKKVAKTVTKKATAVKKTAAPKTTTKKSTAKKTTKK